MATEGVRDRQETITLLTSGELVADFIPWNAGEHGQQAYLKLTQEDRAAYLYAGVGSILELEIQKSLMRLLNDGWTLQGEVFVEFDGTREPGTKGVALVDPVVLELGGGLLPLVDPYQGAPLLEKLPGLRHELAEDVGFLAPAVKVRDNLTLSANGYRVRLRGAPTAQGELFLDRLLAVGSLEQLGALQGWTTIEPTYRMPAKWIPPEARETAEQGGCMLLGSLAVLLTHLRETVREAAPRLLGLQDVADMVARLAPTHPVVVEPFNGRAERLRRLRRVLQTLLSEGVPIGDLVTILEVVGDNPDGEVDAGVEEVRLALAPQIVTRYTDDEGTLRALVLSDEAESAAAKMDEEFCDQLTRRVREALEEHQQPAVLFAPPPLRRAIRRALEPALPHFPVLSTGEIPSGVKVQVAGPVKWTGAAKAPPKSDGAPDSGGFWKTRKKKGE